MIKADNHNHKQKDQSSPVSFLEEPKCRQRFQVPGPANLQPQSPDYHDYRDEDYHDHDQEYDDHG